MILYKTQNLFNCVCKKFLHQIHLRVYLDNWGLKKTNVWYKSRHDIWRGCSIYTVYGVICRDVCLLLQPLHTCISLQCTAILSKKVQMCSEGCKVVHCSKVVLCSEKLFTADARKCKCVQRGAKLFTAVKFHAAKNCALQMQESANVFRRVQSCSLQ